MFIVIHCGGMPFNGTTIKISSLGGSETSAYYLSKELAKKGHKVTLFTNSQEEGIWDEVKYVWAGRIDQNTPLGDRFHYYAENTPHDVLIIQRHPLAFRYNWASKINLWHLHDLAQIRTAGEATAHMWNIDGVLTVSEFHKKQVCETWGINPEIVFPIQNGVDLSLFTTEYVDGMGGRFDLGNYEGTQDQIKLLYTSRPERGLEHLVMPGNIMERLAAINSKYHLYVCGYDNTTQQMAGYYNYLWERCDTLPNVTNLGSLTKQELADVMRQCDALVYPTPGPLQPNFEEVSCITAMEAMAAGLPLISSDVGALSETCRDSGSVLLPLKDGMPNTDAFVETIHKSSGYSSQEKEMQLEAAKRYEWSVAADMLQNHIDFLSAKNRSEGAIAKDMMRNSDVYVLNEFHYAHTIDDGDLIRNTIADEVKECYPFAFQNTWDEHYAKYYEYEKQRGVDYGPEKLDGNSRFEHVCSIIAGLSSGAMVLDYGCAHGHYTVNMAKRFPELLFVGIDITRSNIEKARAWAKQEGVSNVWFIHGRIDEESEGIKILEKSKGIPLTWNIPNYDAIIAAEVLEHVGTPQEHVKVLCKYLKPEGKMVITTPFGPWEAMGYQEHWPWRAHVWHFDRADLHAMWGKLPGFNVAVAPAGKSKWDSPLGSYITTFTNPGSEGIEIKAIDIARKTNIVAPMQTVSLCMIVKDAEATFKQCLDSVKNVVDEIIIAIDETTIDGTEKIINDWISDRKGLWPVVRTISIKSPLEIGFDEARNLSIAQASGDWVMWLDSDEILIHGHNVFKYLRNNQFDGYAIKQHHFAIEPLGVLKTDFPCRLFRNHKGIRFFGVVHEHPEKELNEGVGHAQLLPDVEIAHQGYTTEAIRRGRFHRNIDLLVRDREKYPERVLGKFLWLRDLAQMSRYELDVNGGQITDTMRHRAEEGIAIWLELVEGNHLRMAVEGLEFYSILNKILGVGFEFGMAVDAALISEQLNLERTAPIAGHFNCKEHIDKLFIALTDEKVKDYGKRYY